jgi:hypothetical protein
VFRQPALGVAEITWRWTVALLAWLLVCFLLIEYIDSLVVSRDDLFLLRSGLPWLVVSTIQHILVSGAHRFVAAAVVTVLALAMAWAFAASAGRAATISVLLNHFYDTHTSGIFAPTPARLVSRPLILVHWLRAGLFLASFFAVVGAAIAAAIVGSNRDLHPAIALVLFVGLTLGIAILWYTLDWLLSIAPVFVVRDDAGPFGAISAAVSFVCERFGAVARTGAIFCVIQVFIFIVASSLASVPLALAGMLPPGIVFLSLVLLTLGYFAVIDFLRVARLAAYICIADREPADIQPAAVEC